jgi:hypothetical protein
VQQVRVGADVELPRQVDEREALPQVPRVGIPFADEEAAAAVDDVDVDDAVAARLRPDDVDVAGELDFAARVARRLVDVGDDRVVRVGRIDGIEDAAADALVAVRVIGAGGDLDALDASERRQRNKQKAENRSERYMPPAVMVLGELTRRRSPG